jgi:hypothetical protein
MATGIECCAACACLQPALICFVQTYQNICGNNSNPCIGGDCRVRIQNICSRINIFNHCNCFSSSEVNYNVRGTMMQGAGVINQAPSFQPAAVVDEVARERIASQIASSAPTHQHFEVDV